MTDTLLTGYEVLARLYELEERRVLEGDDPVAVNLHRRASKDDFNYDEALSKLESYEKQNPDRVKFLRKMNLVRSLGVSRFSE